jgi:hypothetical protein
VQVPRAYERRSRKAWPWMLGGAIAVLIAGGLVWNFSRQAQDRQWQDRQAMPTPIASNESAKPSSPPASEANEVVVEFPEVDTSKAPDYTVAARSYLGRLGISVINIEPFGSDIVLLNDRVLYEGQAVTATVSQNLLTQVKTGNARASFTLRFREPARTVSFLRPALYAATNSGITHPAWSVHALDADGHELSSKSEDLIRSFVNVPEAFHVLRALDSRPIAGLRFDSDPRLDGKPFAAFSAVLIERLTLLREPKSSR